MHRTGILFIISAPSGAGKTTLCDRLRRTNQFLYSVSCTTRLPRPNEKDGQDYIFISEGLFKERIKAGYFLEHAKVHGHFYGTPLQPIKDALAQGKDMLLDIDVQGAHQIRSHQDHVIRTALVDIFLMTRTFELLEQRLRNRKTDDEETILRRLAAARSEVAHWGKYAYVIFSGSPEEDEQKFQTIVDAERYRSSRLTLDAF